MGEGAWPQASLEQFGGFLLSRQRASPHGAGQAPGGQFQQLGFFRPEDLPVRRKIRRGDTHQLSFVEQGCPEHGAQTPGPAESQAGDGADIHLVQRPPVLELRQCAP